MKISWWQNSPARVTLWQHSPVDFPMVCWHRPRWLSRSARCNWRTGPGSRGCSMVRLITLLCKAYRGGRLTIRLALGGCTNRPFYRIQLGSYDPLPNSHGEKLVALNLDRIQHWIGSCGKASRSSWVFPSASHGNHKCREAATETGTKQMRGFHSKGRRVVEQTPWWKEVPALRNRDAGSTLSFNPGCCHASCDAGALGFLRGKRKQAGAAARSVPLRAMGPLELCEDVFGTAYLYRVLSVRREVSDGEVWRGYHEMSLQVHLDRVGEGDKDATRHFQILGKVYSVLSDKDQRAVYDEQGTVD
ncbi:DnaJ-like protein subfamily C member 9 [Camelus dromedarius]|uniref:DnaJ-like protein subfamily C member 9 n=1 Tax=Camelus dromedarius TaxID=9838 RepID=A0A5N4E3S8_CAMDR|nr:DnaJ-like protein subfamily C member 9 [Camelus dromedarius]